jgi:hypothetical protein
LELPQLGTQREPTQLKLNQPDLADVMGLLKTHELQILQHLLLDLMQFE